MPVARAAVSIMLREKLIIFHSYQPGAERLANEKITIIIVYRPALLHVLCDQNKQKPLLGEGKNGVLAPLL